jgi:hypothetical protein
MSRGGVRLFWVAVLLVIGLDGLAAADLSVVYVEGLLQLKQGTAWKALDIGDEVQDTSTIQFDGQGVAELEGAGVRITLRQAGSFVVSDVIAKTREVSSTGLGSLVRGRVSGVFQGAPRTASTVAGVRAAEAGTEQATVSWIGNAADLIAGARQELGAGEYQKALDTLEEAYEYADEYEAPIVLFYMGYAQAMLGNNAQALDTLNGADLTPDSEYYGDLLILRGQLLVDALAFKDAYTSFDAYRGKYPTGAEVQLANLMAGYCAGQLGDRAEARRSLDLARAADPASDLGKKAGELLGHL